MTYEKLVYENGLGEKLEFGDEDGLYINQSDIRDYTWSYTTANNRIKRFYRKIKTFKLPVYVLATSEEAATELKNRLYTIADKDIQSGTQGKIWCGEYYMPCYITGSAKSSYTKAGQYLATKMTIVSDNPCWTKELSTYYKEEDVKIEGGIDYAYDYAYDYASTVSQLVFNTSYTALDFRLTIYGACDTIAVTIGENQYNIDYSLKYGEYAVIDSREKAAYAVSAIGTKTNIFNLRDREHYIFEKIPTGALAIGRDTQIDITLYDERSEPLWT